jgi:hypothetical protein
MKNTRQYLALYRGISCHFTAHKRQGSKGTNAILEFIKIDKKKKSVEEILHSIPHQKNDV